MKLRPSLGVWLFLLALSLWAIIPPPAADGAVVVTRGTDPEFSSFGLSSSIGYTFHPTCDYFACYGPPDIFVDILWDGVLSNDIVYSTYNTTISEGASGGTRVHGDEFTYGRQYYVIPGYNFVRMIDPITSITSYLMFNLEYSGVYNHSYYRHIPYLRGIGYDHEIDYNLYNQTYTDVPIVSFLAVASGPGLTLGDAQAAIANSAVSTVPEPTSFLASLIVCCIGILYRRRPRRSA